MAGTLTQAAVNTDFDEIWSHYSLGAGKRLPEPVKAKRLLRTIHKFGIVTSILSRSIPSQRPEHKRIFLKEFSSDAVHLMHTILVGDARAGHFYFRSVIENLWRHIYFKDHPIEYRRLHSDEKFHIAIGTLRDYCSTTAELDHRIKDSLQRVANGYQKLSRLVHSSKGSSLQLQGRLAEIHISTGKLAELVRDLQSFGRDLVLIALVLHAAEVARHPREERFAINYLDGRRKKLRLEVLS